MRGKSFERQRELLDAALDEFSTHSYDDASLNNIINNAGISKGTFYYHFRGKEDLYLFLLEAAVKAKWDFIRKAAGERPPGDLEPRDIFDKFKLQARLGVQFAASFPKYDRLARMFTQERNSRVRELARRKLGRDTDAILEAMIVEAIEAGDFNSSFPKDFIIRVMSHLMTHFDDIFPAEQTSTSDPAALLECVDRYVDFLRDGLGRPHNRNRSYSGGRQTPHGV